VLSLDRLAEDGFGYADSSSVPDLVEDKLELELLASALDKLTPEEKSLIRALFYDERTVRDYAAEIGISHQAVVKRKQKILDKLRSLIDADK
jgi:RNA polymerase sigma factor (sigma-70 family)